MDDVTIKYGDRELHLRKSHRYVAIKPRSGVDPRVAAQMTPEIGRVVGPPGSLGGFHVVKIDDVAAPAGRVDSRATGLAAAEHTLDMLRQNPAVATGTHVFETSNDGVPFVPTGQLYIEYAPDADLAESERLLADHHLQIVEARGDRALIAQVTSASQNPLKVAAELQKSPLVAVAEPDLATPGKTLAFTRPSDGRLVDQWHLRNEGRHRGTTMGFKAGADARVTAAWQRAGSLGSPSVVVGIIDDGFDLTHPDLSGEWKIVAPKDFTRRSASPLPDPQEADWHGTACAGVALGNADGTGIVGVAPRCRLMPIRWGRSLSDSEIEDWFGYAREQGAWVVSCSWGAAAQNFPLSRRASIAIERCAREGRGGLGTVICFAAGNESRDIDDVANQSVNGFAIHPDVIAVAASTSRDQGSHYSNYGAAISLCAPSSGAGGWGITTSDVMGQYSRGGQTFEAGYATGAYTDDFGGTSSACPLVAGVCALLLSIRPSLTAADVRSVIEQTARKIGLPHDYDADGRSTQFGYGCINADAAVESLLGG